jgi:hypothetical protein
MTPDKSLSLESELVSRDRHLPASYSRKSLLFFDLWVAQRGEDWLGGGPCSPRRLKGPPVQYEFTEHRLQVSGSSVASPRVLRFSLDELLSAVRKETTNSSEYTSSSLAA